MHQCNRCGREFKSKAGLGKHGKGCSVEPEQEEVIVEEVSNEVVSNVESSDRVARRIAKLKDAYKSTWDAEQRHLIDLQIKELTRSL